MISEESCAWSNDAKNSALKSGIKVRSCHITIIVIVRYQLVKSVHVLVKLVITSCELGVFWELRLVPHDRCSSRRTREKWRRFQKSYYYSKKAENRYLYSWPKILAPLVNMIKEGCENLSALLILFIFHYKNSHKSKLSLHNKNLNGGNINIK